MTKVTVHITTTDDLVGYDFTYEQPDIPTYHMIEPENDAFRRMSPTQPNLGFWPVLIGLSVSILIMIALYVSFSILLDRV